MHHAAGLTAANTTHIYHIMLYGKAAKSVSCSLCPPYTSAIEKLAGRVVSFEDSVTLLREGLAEVLEKEEEWSKAAQVLTGIDLDSSTRQVHICGWNTPHTGLMWLSMVTPCMRVMLM